MSHNFVEEKAREEREENKNNNNIGLKRSFVIPKHKIENPLIILIGISIYEKSDSKIKYDGHPHNVINNNIQNMKFLFNDLFGFKTLKSIDDSIYNKNREREGLYFTK